MILFFYEQELKGRKGGLFVLGFFHLVRVCVPSCFSCVRLCDPMDCSLPGSSVHGDSPGKNTGVGCHALVQGIFPTQRWNLHLLCLLQAGRFLTLLPQISFTD